MCLWCRSEYETIDLEVGKGLFNNRKKLPRKLSFHFAKFIRDNARSTKKCLCGLLNFLESSGREIYLI